MPVMTYREALRRAMNEEMERDPEVFIIGEEVAEYQGTFRVTEGLLERYGAERVIDTPISEEGFTAVAVGAAMAGLKPIVEFMTINFSIRALDQIVNHAAKMLYMSGGQFAMPMVIRGPNGKGERLAAQHSHALENWFIAMPGLKVVLPSTPADACGLLKAAIRDPNPVIFLEHAALYTLKGEVPENLEPVPLGKGIVRREGKHVTLVSYSRMSILCERAAEALANEGIEAEVVDLRSLVPMDEELLLASIAKTHRAVVVTEESRTGSVAAEIVARISRLAFDELDAPVEMVTGPDTPMPYARNLERLWAPDEAAIVEAARRTVAREESGAGTAELGGERFMPELTMPKMGDAMEEVYILRWLKKEGDRVEEQEDVAEIQTKKATITIPATEAGILTRILVKEGETVAVGTAIAIVGDENGAAPAKGVAPAAEAAPVKSEPQQQAKPEGAKAETGASEEQVGKDAPTPSTPEADVSDQAAPPSANASHPPTQGEGGRVKASPLARKVAAAHGVDLGSVQGTGPGGRIIEADVEDARKRGPAPAAPAPEKAAEPAAGPKAAPAPAPSLAGTEKKMSPVRKVIARRLSESKQTIPHFYLNVDVDMRAAMKLRKEFNDAAGEERKISVNDLVIKASALALEKHPLLQSRLEGEMIRIPASINIGVAVSLEEGLVVPVIRDAQNLGISAIGREVRQLAERARNGQLKPEEYSGGTFTVSNLGMYEITQFQAIINPPEAAILAVGAVRDTPVVEGDQVVPGKQMFLTLSVDHRTVDGSVAAQFMQELKRLLQNPMGLLG